MPTARMKTLPAGTWAAQTSSKTKICPVKGKAAGAMLPHRVAHVIQTDVASRSENHPLNTGEHRD